MKIKLIRNTAISGYHVTIGDVIDADDIEGNKLIRMGKAEISSEEIDPPKKRGRPKKETIDIEATNE